MSGFELAPDGGDDPVSQNDHLLVPNKHDDPVQAIESTLRKGQEALNRVLEECPKLFFGSVRAKIAKSVAEAQLTMSAAQARMEEIAIAKQKQADAHAAKLRELDISSEEKKVRARIERAEMVARGFEKIVSAAVKLKALGFSKAEIKKCIMEGLAVLKSDDEL